MEKTLLKEALQRLCFEVLNKETRKIQEVLQKTKHMDLSVPTDKNNSNQLILINNYKRWVSNHILKATELALHPKVISLFDEANGLFEKVKMDFSFQEERFVRQLIATQATLYPKILI